MHNDVAVLGSGPAGFYCALTCARLGLKTILVERDSFGGTGFRWGCLPVKMMLDRLRAGSQTATPASLIPEASRRIQQIEKRIRTRLEGAGVQVVRGESRFADPRTLQVGDRSISATHVVIATGSEPAGWPGVPLDGETVISHRDVLALKQIPQHLLILGGDVEGIELACVFAHLGGAVTVIEKESRILPGTDADLAEGVAELLLARGVAVRTGAEVSGCTLGREALVSLKDGSTLEGDRILPTGLRRPNLPAGIDRAGIEHGGGKIPVNAELRAGSETIYAVGDINGLCGMAHAAIQQAVEVARRIAGAGEPDRAAATGPPYPRAIYTIPEIAGAGYQENELQAQGIPYRRAACSLADTWRGFSKQVDRGFLKVLVGDKKRILGLWICGAEASEQASLFGSLLTSGPTVDTLLRGLILHPTLGEAALEAVLRLDQ